MARPRKLTVAYFPHDTDASERRTLTIIQAKYGNDGYAFWFKLLQLLGRSPGLFYDYNNPADLEFLCAKTHQKDTETILAMLETLSTLGAIDKELHKNRIIWTQHFVDGVSDAFDRTVDGLPKRPEVTARYCFECGNLLTDMRTDAKFCSDSCRQKSHRSNLSVTAEKGLMQLKAPNLLTETAEINTETRENGTETTQKKRKEIRRKETILSLPLPDWLNKETWDAFLEMRKSKKAYPTDKAKELLLKELEKLKTEGNDPNDVLNQSIMRNYTGVFPVKEVRQNGTDRAKNKQGIPGNRPAGAFDDL